jgi:hypothetical protein
MIINLSSSSVRKIHPFIYIFLVDYGKIHDQHSPAPSHDSNLWTIKSVVDEDKNTDGQ